jgi:hypothetical protein
MEMTDKTAKELLEELFKTEKKLQKWRRHGIGVILSKETYKALKGSSHPKKDYILQGVLVERRGSLRY